MTPNNEQLMSLLRTLLQIAGTAIVAHGTLGINGAMWEQISGAVIMIAPIVWSMFAHTDAASIAKVAAMPDVEKIVVQPKAADDVGAALADPTQTKVVSQ
jgi:hypothetical protein